MAIHERSSTPEPTKPIPENYRKGARPTWHQRRRHRAVLSLLKSVPGTVLDYGCGYGDLAHAISRTHTVVGCDVDPDRVAFARREYAPLEFALCQDDLAPFAGGSFDVVVSAVVIHFVDDPAKHLQDIRRLLRTGGHLLIVVKCSHLVRNWFRRLVRRGDVRSRLWVRSRKQYVRFLSDAGFEVMDSTYFYDPPFEGWKNFGDWAFGVIDQFLSVIRVNAAAGYHVFLTRSVDR